MQLGGFRHKTTGQVYLHAMAQTETSFLCPQLSTTTTTRWTQTSAPTRHQGQQTNRDEWTQYSKVAYFRGDKTIEPRPYETAEDQAAHLIQQVVVIQKYWRGHIARKLYKRMIADKMRLEEQKICRINEEPCSLDIHQKLIEGQFNSKKDFELLQQQLSEWKKEQMVHLMNNVPRWDERGRRVAIRWVVDREAQMIALIGQHKRLAAKQKQQRMTDHLLTMVSRPKRWTLPSGREVIVLTPVILHLQQMRALYYQLVGEPSSRLEVLKQLSRVMNVEDQDTLVGQMAEEIRRLVDREIEMVRSKTPIANCLGLRLRLRNLLLRYIFIVHLVQQTQNCLETKLYDEEVTMKSGRCWKCGRFRYLTSKSRCEMCQNSELTSKANEDIYSAWLRDLQRREKIYGDTSGPAFFLKKDDIKYLVEKIWMRRSALSGVDDLNQLQLCRWDPKEMWSPWNCILLTRDEAWLHQSVADNQKNYDPVFVRKLRHRQMLGLQHFSQIQN